MDALGGAAAAAGLPGKGGACAAAASEAAGGTPDTATTPSRSLSPCSGGEESPGGAEDLGAPAADVAAATPGRGTGAKSAAPVAAPRVAGQEAVAKERAEAARGAVLGGKGAGAAAAEGRRGKPLGRAWAAEGGKGGGEAAQAPLGMGLPAFAVLPAVPGLGPAMNSFSDRRIIEVLAAPEATHRRLIRTARRVPEILADPAEPQLVTSTELYGSLSLDMSEPNLHRPWKQDWASYYVNGRSDVDFVVQTKHKVAPAAVAQRLLAKGPWRLLGQVQVHKFASTQLTLLGSFEEEEGRPVEVYLDVTVIEQKLHFSRFKSRQEAFRRVFVEVRSCIEAQFGAQGALAFDAYVHLLKAFAAKVPGNGLTGFQATCIGLFTLQIGHFKLKQTQSIALSLFEGFLRFCASFYGDRPEGWQTWSYRQQAIDLCNGGRWLPRMSTSWHSELYFMATEQRMHTRPDERMNVTHSLDPARVSLEALALLKRAFFPAPGAEAWPGAWAPGRREAAAAALCQAP